MLNSPFMVRWAIPLLLLSAVALIAVLVLIPRNEGGPTVDRVIEALIPAANDEVLSQVDVGIDLIDGYTAELTINGVEIPEQQLRRVEALNQVFFRPDQGQVISAWRADQNCAVALYWPLAQGRQAARSVSWCFTAS